MKIAKSESNSIKLFIILLFIFISTSLIGGCGGGSSSLSNNIITPVSSKRNVILIIGDGMGPEQIKAGSIYLNGTLESLIFQDSSFFPYHTRVTTHSANDAVTDSAASATAIATGFKVNNYEISYHNSEKLVTALEYHKSRERYTGLVTTAFITHATPAAFGAHNTSRLNYDDIAEDYLKNSKPNILFGGNLFLKRSDAENAGYSIVTNKNELQNLEYQSINYIAGLFYPNYLPYETETYGDIPHLSDMADAALKILENKDKGFFLLIEGGRIDHACHENNISKTVAEMVEFNKTVQVVFSWAATRNDTTIIITADHETGGLTVTKNNGKGNIPTVTWQTIQHTAANVDVWGFGLNSSMIKSFTDNTDIYKLLISE